MAEKFIAEWFHAAVGEGTLHHVDFDEYSQRLQDVYERFDKADYDVVQVVPIVMTTAEAQERRDGTYVGHSVFPITRGAVVVGQKRTA